ncbi:hypothetical protein [Microbacterium sp. Leaf320]|nr:hypothetical protein [Microbacterium sp. Leaf320]
MSLDDRGATSSYDDASGPPAEVGDGFDLLDGAVDHPARPLSRS